MHAQNPGSESTNHRPLPVACSRARAFHTRRHGRICSCSEVPYYLLQSPVPHGTNPSFAPVALAHAPNFEVVECPGELNDARRPAGHLRRARQFRSVLSPPTADSNVLDAHSAADSDVDTYGTALKARSLALAGAGEQSPQTRRLIQRGMHIAPAAQTASSTVCAECSQRGHTKGPSTKKKGLGSLLSP